MNITVTVDEDNITSVSFSSMSIGSTGTYRFGPQPPQFAGLSNVAIMKDKDDPDKGPAYFIQQPFDKLVILRETEFPVMNSKRSFHAALDRRDDDDSAQVGDKAWFCFWNGTLLEAFIFVSQDFTPPSLQFSTSTSSTDFYHRITAIPSATNVRSIPTPNSGIGVSIPTTSSGAGNGFSLPIPTPKVWPRHNAMPSSMNYYPKMVKMEERRNYDNEIPPYCQKMQIMNDGSAQPVDDRQELDENQPSSMKRREWFGMLSFASKRDSVKGCQCNWMNG